MYPLVTRVPIRRADPLELSQEAAARMGYNSHLLSQAQIERLETVAGMNFKPDTRRKLQGIADNWLSHDLVLQSARPRDFRRRLQKMESVARRAIEELDLNATGVSILDRHLLHWLMEAKFDGAQDVLQTSSSIVSLAHALLGPLERAKQSLPPDSGGARPMDEERFIVALAEQFETAGGKARAYSSEHSSSGYGETPFRNFVHAFYDMLPIKSQRTPSGLDDAIRRALHRRRRAKKG
jgi:hypothetical protein